mmetsp:Transcript_29239/g.68040  ORF Transcript_29239/g.68040 Transcript_29239/m.68040 type:complete len:260 (+) Transcript_29239:88-867(+)
MLTAWILGEGSGIWLRCCCGCCCCDAGDCCTLGHCCCRCCCCSCCCLCSCCLATATGVGCLGLMLPCLCCCGCLFGAAWLAAVAPWKCGGCCDGVGCRGLLEPWRGEGCTVEPVGCRCCCRGLLPPACGTPLPGCEEALLAATWVPGACAVVFCGVGTHAKPAGKGTFWRGGPARIAVGATANARLVALQRGSASHCEGWVGTRGGSPGSMRRSGRPPGNAASANPGLGFFSSFTICCPGALAISLLARSSTSNLTRSI